MQDWPSPSSSAALLVDHKHYNKKEGSGTKKNARSRRKETHSYSSMDTDDQVSNDSTAFKYENGNIPNVENGDVNQNHKTDSCKCPRYE